MHEGIAIQHFNDIRRAVGLGIEASPNVSRLSYYSLTLWRRNYFFNFSTLCI